MSPEELEKRIEKAKERRDISLNLPDALINVLPKKLGRLAQLQYLHLPRNQLTELPESIGQLVQLQRLNLSGNQLNQLPSSFARLTKLQRLDLSVNQIAQIPTGIGQLRQLQHLYLSGNGIAAIPESFNQLVNLEVLDLSDNALATLPRSLLKLGERGALRKIFLHGNDALGLPNSVLGPHSSKCKGFGGTKEAALPLDILEYYFRESPPTPSGSKVPSLEPTLSPGGPKLQVFLCHASPDKQRVREIYSWLQEKGFEPWLDAEKLDPGDDWREEITMAVERAHIVLACISEHSVNKEGFVQREIRIALDVADEKPEGTIYIIPVKLEECTIPRRLSRWQWLNLFESDGYERLARSLRKRREKLGG